MNKPIGVFLVHELAGRRIVIEWTGPTDTPGYIYDLGFEHEKTRFAKSVSDDFERVDVIKSLITHKALFIGGAGWSPAELVIYYKEQGKLHESFSEIIWRNPEQYEIVPH